MNNIYFRNMKKLTLLAFMQLACFFSFGQWQVRDSSLFNPHVTVGYGYSIPGGDLANRFGNNGSLEVGFHVKDKKIGTTVFSSITSLETRFMSRIC